MTKEYPCCTCPDCQHCGGSGVVSGPEVDAFMAALDDLPPAYDTPQDACPACGSGSYEAWPFGAAYLIRCADCDTRWVEP